MPAATARRFLAGVGLQSLGRGGQALAAFVTVLVLAAALDAPLLGIYGVYETLFALAEVLIDGGSGNAVVRRAGARPAALRPALRQAWRFRLATTLIAAAAITAYAGLDSAAGAGHPGLALATLALASHLATTRAAVFQLRLRFGLPAVLRTLTAVLVLVAVTAVLAAGVRDPLWCLAAAQGARAAGNLCLGLAAGRLLREYPAAGPPETGFLSECLALGAGGLVREAYGRMDLLLVRALLGTAAAGVYTPIRKLFHLALQLPSFIGVVAMPSLAAAADRTELRARCVTLARRTAWIGFPAALLAVPLAPWFVERFFGPAFTAGVVPLQVLGAAAALVFPGSVLTTGLVAAGAARETLRLALVVLVVALAGNLALLPAAGLTGAAVARVLAEAVALVGAARLLRGGAPGGV